MKNVKTLGGNNKLLKSFVFLTSFTLIFNMSMLGVFFVAEDVIATDEKLCEPWGGYGGCEHSSGYPGCYINDECRTDLYCGDGIPTLPPEECDNGEANYAEGSMDPVWSLNEGDGDRDYCSLECSIFHVPGTWCGDGVINGPETCDNGINNGVECNPDYESTCEYCSGSCDLIVLEGGYCGDGIMQDEEECEVGYDCCPGYICQDCLCTENCIDEICDNGIDDDCDGLIDSDDPDCYELPDTITIYAHKIVCESEDLLPNWSGGADITADTAADFVDSVDGCNWTEDEWEFQWGTYNANSSYNGNYLGKIGDWNDFNTASSWSNPAQLMLNLDDIDGRLWFREVLKDGYLSFSYPPGSTPGNDVSAEFYCNADVLNYDNMEWMDLMESNSGDEYYCVAFNSLEEIPNTGQVEVCKLIDADGDSETTDDQLPVDAAWTFQVWQVDSLVASETTTETNCVLFEDLPAGEGYWVQEVGQEGWALMIPETGAYQFSIEGGEELDYEFINYKTCDYKIEGHKYSDYGCATPIEGWGIILMDNDGEEVLATTTTDSEGYYSFGDLCSGAYQVHEEEVWGWERVYPVEPNYYEIELPDGGGDYYFRNKPLICGTKYNYNTDEPLEGWEINFSVTAEPGGEISFITLLGQAVTDSEGNYCFDISDYDVSLPSWFNLAETMQSGWLAHSSTSETFEFDGSSAYFVDFYNYPEEDEPYCGDGTCNGDEDCANCEEDCGSCGGGGGPYCGDGTCNGSEQCNQCVEDCGACGAILPPATSGGGTPAPGPVVLGEEGAPMLVITKSAAQEFANPGDSNIGYKINITNNGNLTAFDVNLSDVLPEGFSFVDGGVKEKTWVIGDIAPGATKGVEYLVNIDESVDANIYANIAEVWAANADKTSATADIEVREVAVLAESGFDISELGLLLIFTGSLIVSTQALRRKYLSL